MIGMSGVSPNRPGYVFVLTLAVIATLALVLAGAHLAQQTSARAAAQLLDQSRLERDLRSAQAHAIHLLLTQPGGEFAVHFGGVLNPDGMEGGFVEAGELIDARGQPRRIKINGRTVLIRLVSVQGLVGLSPEDPRKTQLFLEQAGHRPAEALRLAAALADYADEDDLRRLGGAERRDYPDMRFPANGPLRSAREACAVLGWEKTQLCREDPRLMDIYVSTDLDAASNPRFVPDHVLTFLLPDERSLSLVQRRIESGSVARFADLGLADWDSAHETEFGYGPVGAEFLILTHDVHAHLVLATRVALTPGSLDKPYRTLFEFLIGGDRVEQAFRHDDAEELAAFPLAQPSSARAGRP
jgi:hypothetical protein